MSTSDLDKFKRRLIRSVVRLLAEKRPEKEIWAQMQKESGCNCELLWKRMRLLTLKKLQRLLAAEDKPANVASVARLNRTDWLMVDLVLVHESHDFIGLGKLASSRTEYRPMMDLFSLVQRYQLEDPRADVERWAAATKAYNTEGRMCSPMLLQRRWYLLKEVTRSNFYSLWMNYRGNSKLWEQCQQFIPTRLQMTVAKKFPHVITEPFPTWEELIEQGRVILPAQFEARIKNGPQPVAKPVANTGTESDLVLVEPHIETIDLGVESDNEENTDQNLNEDHDSKDSAQNDDSNLFAPHTSNIQAGDCNDTQHQVDAQADPSATLSNKSLLTDIQIKKEPIEEDGLSNVKILAATHIPLETLENANDIENDTESEILSHIGKIKQEVQDHRTVDVNSRAENINRFLESTEDLLQDDGFSIGDDNDAIIAQKAEEFLKSTSKPSEVNEIDIRTAQKTKDYIKPSSTNKEVDETEALIAQKANNYVKTTLASIIENTEVSKAQKAKTNKDSADGSKIIDETDDLIAMKVNDYLKQSSVAAKTIVDSKIADTTSKGDTFTSKTDISASEKNSVAKNNASPIEASLVTVISSSNDEDSDNIDNIIKQKADNFLNKQVQIEKPNLNDENSNQAVDEQDKQENIEDTNKISDIDDMEMDPISYRMDEAEKYIEFVDDGIVEEEDENDHSKDNPNFPAPIIEKVVIKKELCVEEELGEYVPQTFDLKLIMMPVIFCIKLEEIPVFKGKPLKYPIRQKEVIEKIIQENKPILKHNDSELTSIKREMVKQEEDTHENDDLFHNPYSDKTACSDVVNETLNAKVSTITTDKIEETILKNVDETILPLNHEIIKQEEQIQENDDVSHISYSDNSDCESVSDSVTDDQKVKITSYLLKKPRNRSYNPIQLCKNPDFNTRLKRLPVGFFSSMRNRQLLKSCKPMTIDLHKAFEPKLINGTLYLKPCKLTSASQIVVEKEDDSAVTAVVPSAMPVQSLIDNTITELRPIENQTSAVVIDDDEDYDDKPLSRSATNIKHLVDNTLKDLLPSEYNSQTEKGISNNMSTSASSEVSLQPNTGNAVPNLAMSWLHGNEKADEVIERNKTINLPDISKVRAINQKLLTAEVPPIRVQQPDKNIEQVTPVQTQNENSNDSNSINENEVDWRRKPRTITKPLNLPPGKTIFNRDIPCRLPVPWNKPHVSGKSKLDDCLLTIDTLNKMINKINGIETSGKSCKQKTNWILEDIFALPKHSSANSKSNQAAKKPKPPRILKEYCCWVRYRNEKLKRKQRVNTSHPCPVSNCSCCCELERFSSKIPKDTICLSDDEEALKNACASIESVVQQANVPTPEVKVYRKKTRQRRPRYSMRDEHVRGIPMNVATVRSDQRLTCSQGVQCGSDNNLQNVVSTQPIISVASNLITGSTTTTKPNLTTPTLSISPLNVDVSQPLLSQVRSVDPNSLSNSSNSTISTSHVELSQPQITNQGTLSDDNLIPQHKIIVSFPSPSLSNAQTHEISIQTDIAKPTVKRKPYITIMPNNSASYIDINQRRLILNNRSQELAQTVHHMSIQKKPLEKPIFLGKNKVLLTTVKFPPEIRSVVLRNEAQANPKVIPTMPLPPGVQLVLMPNGQLTCVMDPSVQLEPEQLESLPALLALIQQQLQQTGTLGPLNPTTTVSPNQNTNTLECNHQVISLSDDEEQVSQTMNVRNIAQSNSEPVKPTEVNECNESNNTDTLETIFEVVKPPDRTSNEPNIEHIETNSDATKNTTEVTETNSEVAVANTENVLCDLENSTTKELQQQSDVPQDIIASYSSKETGSEKVVEKSIESAIGNTEIPKISADNNVDETNIEKDNPESIATTDSNQKENCEQTNQSAGRNLLSDLMEMSGISEEDIKQTSQEIVLQATPEISNSIVVDPNFNMPAQVADQNMSCSIPPLVPINEMNSVSELDTVNLPELTPITSLAELRYACDNNGKFFKLDLETGSISSIVVCIKKTKLKKRNELNDVTVDLTIDDEVETPDDTDQQTPDLQRVATDVNSDTPRPVKLIKAVHQPTKPKHYVSILKKAIPVNETRTPKTHRRKRKEVLKARIEANINLADCDEPMEEEYLDDQILESDYTVVYHSSGSLNDSVKSMQVIDDDSESDDEPLAIKAKRMRREETSPENVPAEAIEDVTPVVNEPSTSKETLAFPSENDVSVSLDKGNVPTESEPVPENQSPVEDLNTSIPLETMDIDDTEDDDCILGF